MDTIKQLETYKPVLLNLDELSSYEQWALNFFKNPQVIANPNIDMTIQLNISQSYITYERYFSDNEITTYTAYLIWRMVQTISRHPCFTFRLVNDIWYRFDNLPLFFPVASGSKERFSEVLMENVINQGWESFAHEYRNRIIRVQSNGEKFSNLSEELWRVAMFIGNLPNLRFTSLRPHTGVARTGRPIFYFGQRYKSANSQYVPLSIYFDHSNIDPVVLDLFLKDYKQAIIQTY